MSTEGKRPKLGRKKAQLLIHLFTHYPFIHSTQCKSQQRELNNSEADRNFSSLGGGPESQKEGSHNTHTTRDITPGSSGAGDPLARRGHGNRQSRPGHRARALVATNSPESHAQLIALISSRDTNSGLLRWRFKD